MKTDATRRRGENQRSDFEMREKEEKKSKLDGECFCYCAMFILDYLLILVIIPVCAIANWIGTYYFLVYFNQSKPWYNEIKIALITICVIIFAAKHLFRGLIYKYIRDHVESEVKFYIVSRIYLYTFSLCSTIVFAGVFESKFFNDLITFKKSNPEAKATNTTNTTDVPATASTEESEGDPLYCIAYTTIGFFFLFCLKCRPHLAGGAGDVGREKTAEDVFVFPTTFSDTTVSSSFPIIHLKTTLKIIIPRVDSIGLFF